MLTGLTAACTLPAALLAPRVATAAPALKLGSPQPFSFEALVREAQASAARPYVAAPPFPREVLEHLDYEALGKIHFDPACALFRDGPGPYPVTFFHLGRFSPTAVRMFALSGDADHLEARELSYEQDCFRMPDSSPARSLPRSAGYAGFRVQESRTGDQSHLDWKSNDWAAFLGASYFRTIGELYQYGISARGIAVNTATAGVDEEFPDFTRFYLLPADEAAHQLTVFALLQGPSVAGAYRFVLHRQKAVLTEVEARLFLRRDITRLGIAPLTSMYWFSETTKPQAVDWRPEVHDSDGLAFWTRGGEHVWRPLNAPAHPVASAFGDQAPRGFGLLQRDRNFDHYLDGVFYERRPSLWVEPLDDWGAGSIQLIEAPTDDEIQDNVSAMWVPHRAATAGSQFQFRYRLYWAADEPFPSSLARCVATRLGRGGQPGQPRPGGVRKFMVEFLGGPLGELPYGVHPEAVLWASSGSFSYVFTEAVPDGVSGHWRAQFDFTAAGAQPVDMRLYLRLGERTLSETWLYQYRPS